MNNVNFSGLCRVCLIDGATFPIFGKSENEDKNILSKLSLCVSEKIEDDEGLPRHICSSCRATLETLCDFINKFRETNKLLQNGLAIVKKELHTIDVECVDPPEIQIKIIKTESDDDFDNVSLRSLEPPLVKVKKKIKKESQKIKGSKNKLDTFKVANRCGNETNKIASSILEGNFSWNGERWCTQVGQSPLKKGPRSSDNNRPRPQNKIKVPQTRTKAQTQKLCDLCGDVFKSQYKLSSHKKKVHHKNPVQCPKCPRVCVSEYYLNKHIKRKHETNKNFICSTCGQAFAFKGELSSHFKNVHNKHLIPKKIYSCKFCDKTYKCAKSIVVHERSVHTGQRPAVCSICGSCFYHVDYLKEHMRLHTGETPFKCPICGRGYAQRCNMKSHLRIHRISELDAITLSKMKPNYLKLLKV